MSSSVCVSVTRPDTNIPHPAVSPNSGHDLEVPKPINHRSGGDAAKDASEMLCCGQRFSSCTLPPFLRAPA
eukprot:7720824-Pyramimonas_sp.AAC.1